jgi:hypothetical protein
VDKRKLVRSTKIIVAWSKKLDVTPLCLNNKWVNYRKKIYGPTVVYYVVILYSIKPFRSIGASSAFEISRVITYKHLCEIPCLY